MQLQLYTLSHDDRREIVKKYCTGAIKLRTREFINKYAQTEWDAEKQGANRNDYLSGIVSVSGIVDN